jgi:hypothetical protein
VAVLQRIAAALEISLLGLVPDLPADNRKPGVKIVASKRRGQLDVGTDRRRYTSLDCTIAA